MASIAMYSSFLLKWLRVNALTVLRLYSFKSSWTPWTFQWKDLTVINIDKYGSLRKHKACGEYTVGKNEVNMTTHYVGRRILSQAHV